MLSSDFLSSEALCILRGSFQNALSSIGKLTGSAQMPYGIGFTSQSIYYIMNFFASYSIFEHDSICQTLMCSIKGNNYMSDIYVIIIQSICQVLGALKHKLSSFGKRQFISHLSLYLYHVSCIYYQSQLIQLPYRHLLLLLQDHFQ